MSKRLTEEEKRYQKRQATVGLASNLLGIGAGTAALATASKNKAFKQPSAETAGPVTSKLLRKIKMSPAGQKKLVLAGAGGAVGLQAANLGGDLVTNRVLSREVHKNDQSMISKADGAVSSNGHGKSLGATLAERGRANVAAKEARLSTKRGGNSNILVGAVSGGGVGGYIGSQVKRKDAWKLVDSNPMYDAVQLVKKPSKKNIALGAVTGAGAIGGLASLENSIARNNHAHRLGVSKGLPSSVNAATTMSAHTADRLSAYQYGRGASRRIAIMRKKGSEPRIVGHKIYKPLEDIDSYKRSGVEARGYSREAIAGKGNRSSFKTSGVGKAYRRFDPEADRQRRAGLYTGVGVLGAGLAGREAANHFTTKAKTAEGKTVRGVVARPGKGRVGLGLAALAGASGAFGAHSYKSGLSTRNQPWT